VVRPIADPHFVAHISPRMLDSVDFPRIAAAIRAYEPAFSDGTNVHLVCGGHGSYTIGARSAAWRRRPSRAVVAASPRR
jgi:hypothetical protein